MGANDVARWMANGGLTEVRGAADPVLRDAAGTIVGCSLLEVTFCRLVYALECASQGVACSL